MNPESFGSVFKWGKNTDVASAFLTSALQEAGTLSKNSNETVFSFTVDSTLKDASWDYFVLSGNFWDLSNRLHSRVCVWVTGDVVGLIFAKGRFLLNNIKKRNAGTVEQSQEEKPTDLQVRFGWTFLSEGGVNEEKLKL